LVGHFDRFRTGKQLAHFCAVCPRNDSSAGKTTTGGLIKAGDELLRQVLIEAAHRLIRYDEHWKAMADRLRANGKKASCHCGGGGESLDTQVVSFDVRTDQVVQT